MDGYDADKYIDMVGTGYDSIADAYFENYRVDIPRVVKDKVAKFDAIFDDGSELLELGCGNDLPFTKQLANRHGVIGVDVSAEQIRRAKANVPSASFINADMTSVELPQESFDGVLALYSIIHVPRERHAQLFASIHSWLKPGGIFTSSHGSSDSEEWVDPNWFGASMYWSHFAPEVTQRLVRDAGFEIESADIEELINPGDGDTERHLWLVARKT